MRVTFFALESCCGSGPCPRLFSLLLWNQKGTDTGSLLFAGMARSHRGLVGGRHAGDGLFAGMARSHNIVRLSSRALLQPGFLLLVDYTSLRYRKELQGFQFGVQAVFFRRLVFGEFLRQFLSFAQKGQVQMLTFALAKSP